MFGMVLVKKLKLLNKSLLNYLFIFTYTIQVIIKKNLIMHTVFKSYLYSNFSQINHFYIKIKLPYLN